MYTEAEVEINKRATKRKKDVPINKKKNMWMKKETKGAKWIKEKRRKKKACSTLALRRKRYDLLAKLESNLKMVEVKSNFHIYSFLIRVHCWLAIVFVLYLAKEFTFCCFCSTPMHTKHAFEKKQVHFVKKKCKNKRDFLSEWV